MVTSRRRFEVQRDWEAEFWRQLRLAIGTVFGSSPDPRLRFLHCDAVGDELGTDRDIEAPNVERGETAWRLRTSATVFGNDRSDARWSLSLLLDARDVDNPDWRALWQRVGERDRAAVDPEAQTLTIDLRATEPSGQGRGRRA